MHNWPLAKRMMNEASKRTSPWKRSLYDYAFLSAFKYLVAFVLLMLGAGLSYEKNDWTWFARCGCLIAILGIILAVADVERALAEKSRKHELGEDTGTEIEHEKVEMMEMIGKVDYWMIILGNLIWGFGDLIGKLVGK